jgi:hypothetical protein
MRDTKGWISAITHVNPPELWDEVRGRTPGSAPAGTARRPVLAAAILVIAVALIGSTLWALGDLDGGADTPLGPGEIVRYPLEGPPQPIAVGGGAAWVHIGAGTDTVTGLVRIDAVTGQHALLDSLKGAWPAVGGGSAWLLCNDDRGCDGGSVLQLDPLTGDVIRSVTLPGRGAQLVGTGEGVWVTHDGGVSLVTAEGEVARTFKGAFNLVGVDASSVWLTGAERGGVIALSSVTGDMIAEIPFADPCNMEVAAGLVWVASCDGGTHEGNDGDELLGIDAATGEVLFRRTIEGYGQMRYADGVLWLAQRDPDDFERIRLVAFDPRTGASLGDPIAIPDTGAEPGADLVPGPIGGPHVFFAIGEGSLWLTDFGAFEVIRMGIPDIAPPSPIETQTAGAPHVAHVRCDQDQTTVLTPLVAVQADGLHIQVENDGRSTSIDVFAGDGGVYGHELGDDTDVVLEAPVAQAMIACDREEPGEDSTSGDELARAVPITLVDPDGLWTSDLLVCGDRKFPDRPEFRAWADGNPVDTDLGAVIRRTIGGVLPSDVLERAGYEQSAYPTWRVVRDGQVVALIPVRKVTETVAFGPLQVCADSGIGDGPAAGMRGTPFEIPDFPRCDPYAAECALVYVSADRYEELGGRHVARPELVQVDGTLCVEDGLYPRGCENHAVATEWFALRLSSTDAETFVERQGCGQDVENLCT